jgi:type I restriction enzyme, S subunit
MKLGTFFEKFDQFADAPDAVAKMRELVLDLAVQGKLAEQKPAEGDGHALLRQIHKKNPPSLTEADAEPVDSELASFPSSWALSKLGEVAQIIRGVTFPGSAKSETRSDGDVACLRTASVQAEIDWDDLIYISPTHVSRTDQWVAPNDVMISMANSYALVGKVAIVRQVPQKATFGAFLAAIRPVLIEPYFLLYVLRGPRMQAAFRACSSQTTNIANISLGRMRPLPFPLPPVAEQKRIVAKVDELMALCDRLAMQQQERDTRHAALARASLARFSDAPTPANLPFLFHPSYAVLPIDLRNSILTLAVQGKLVPQDPEDEPAEECLSRLGLKCTVASLDGAEGEDELLPPAWARVRFEDVALVAGGVTLGRKLGERKTVTLPYLRVANVKRGEIDLTVIKDVSIAEDEIERYALRKNDLLMTEGGDWDKVGRAAIWRAEIPVCLHQNHVFRARMRSPELTPFWFERYFNSPIGRGYFESASKQTTNLASINMRQVRSCPIPLPPLAEQRRIVAKVEQLMALVDELETHLAASRATAANLLSALVAELTT